MCYNEFLSGITVMNDFLFSSEEKKRKEMKVSHGNAVRFSMFSFKN